MSTCYLGCCLWESEGPLAAPSATSEPEERGAQKQGFLLGEKRGVRAGFRTDRGEATSGQNRARL